MIYYYFLFKYQIILYFKILYSCVYTVSGPGSQCARFNGSGTRLLCNEWDRSQLVVYNLSPHKKQPINNGTILLKAKDFSNKQVSYQACCFAGTDDELAISGSMDNNLFIWSLPGENGDGQDQTVDQSLTILKGHSFRILCFATARNSQ